MRVRARRRSVMLGALLLLSLHASPTVAQEWFDEYARGVEALKKRKPEEAIRHLERAVRRRSEPGTNLITYGTNRLPEYFPYLKLAEAHLLAGNLEGARQALSVSETKRKEPSETRALLEARAREMEAAEPEASPPAPAPSPPVSTTSTAPSMSPVPMPLRTGKLVVTSEPESGASVVANGKFLGVTPLSIDLDPGRYDLKVVKEGSRPESLSLEIAPGETSVVTAHLTSLPRPPEPRLSPPAPALAPPTTAPPEAKPALLILSHPPAASVYLDDELIGTTDPESGRLLLPEVSRGVHRLRLTRADHEDVLDRIEISSAGETRYEARLAPETPLPPAVETAVKEGVVPSSRWAPWIYFSGAGVTIAGFVLAWRRKGSPVPAPMAVVPALMAPATLTATPRPVNKKVSIARNEGERFGEFRILERMGKGGMAAVHLVERGGKRFALKRPLGAILEDAEFRERFLREAEIGRTLHHPNIIRIFERGEVDGIPYFTMEVIEGETLAKRIERKGISGVRDAAAVVLQIAEALDYAHLKGVVHRDLKPSNIMIAPDGTVKVMDYGIARARRFDGLTLTGDFLGTPNYAAPEAAEGKPIDARSDLYSLGVIFYEMVTGRRPFVGDNPLATLKKHCSEPPTPPSLIAPGVPRHIEMMILRLLEKAPEDRYPDAEALLVELRDYLNRESRR